MKKSITTIALVIAVLGSAPTSASAQTTSDEEMGFGKPLTGWYVRASGMIVLQEDSPLTDNIGNIFNPGGGVVVNSAEVSFDNSFGLSLAAGYDFEDSPFSVELEFTLRATDIESATATGTFPGFSSPISGPASGDVSTQSIMFNGYYHFDFDLSRFGMYAGAGVGLARSDAEMIITHAAIGGTLLFPEENDTTFAYQLMLGVTYQLSDQTQLYGGVRYFDAGDMEFTQFNGENASVNLEFGIKFSF